MMSHPKCAPLVHRGVRLFERAICFVLVLAVPAAVFGWSYGSNTVQNPSEDGASNTGYGPGWVLLSYMPNCPGVGYLFSEGLLGKTNPDHMRINDTRDSTYGYGGSPAITRWPWGFAHGAYDGCAFAYGTSKFEFVNSAPSQCPAAPVPPSERCNSSAFCTNHETDPFCSPRGVWGAQDGEPNGKDGYSLGCEVFANIGYAGVFSSSPSPAQSLGLVPAGALLDVRYVTKDRSYAWGKWTGHSFVNGVVWAFFPRWCVAETAPGPSPTPTPAPTGCESCDDGNPCTKDVCTSGQCAHSLTARCLAPMVSLLASVDSCGDGAIDVGEQCDDGNASGDCCSASCHFEPQGAPCVDGNACTIGDMCDGGGACSGTCDIGASCGTICGATLTCQENAAGTCECAP